MQRCNVDECGDDEREKQAYPASEERGCHVVAELEQITRVYHAERLERQDIARQDEEGRHGEVAAAKEDTDAGESRKVIVSLEAETRLEELGLTGPIVRIELVVLNVDQESCEASQSVEICGRS